ncbi:NADH dehydrogenase [ubiquinone] 1 alpha subcomplex subunit 13-like [Patiria miniata]|uniref:NADH dehydrogenase [ubiquinone] 1 alpha subcomplex subunit 13 n=1 Tax=Patiria miniata TaxID=46514 RepID=A0A914BCU7_PATMI|nr:NADH dehydrogenase [ubiquinone] 1 alpha subcomplex subunit 13-like [Patiria miniata]
MFAVGQVDRSSNMASTFKQDMPPKGGYPPIDYKRVLPKRGMSGYMMFATCAAVMGVGTFFFGRHNRQRRLWQREEYESFIGIMPLLKAEDDRQKLKILKSNFEQEAIIMKDVPGWKAGESIYESKRWMDPMLVDLYYLHPKKVRDKELFGFSTYV